jgi:hypothetical protein
MMIRWTLDERALLGRLAERAGTTLADALRQAVRNEALRYRLPVPKLAAPPTRKRGG